MRSTGGLMCFTDLGSTQMAVRYVILSAGGWCMVALRGLEGGQMTQIPLLRFMMAD